MDLERVLIWPRETWSEQETRHVNARRAGIQSELRALVDEAERFDRTLTVGERERYDALQTEFDRLTGALSAAR
jgi:hypothetical protein